MAFIGMRKVVAAPVATEPSGDMPTYSAGFVVGKAIAGNLTINRSDNPLFADDAIAENDNGITSMSLELGVDDIDEAVRTQLLGLVTEGENAAQQYLDTDASAPYVGVGYIRVRRKAGVTSFQALWYPKVQFSETAENAATKNESIEWQTPSITGTVFGVDGPNNSKVFRIYKFFTTEAAAYAWLTDASKAHL